MSAWTWAVLSFGIGVLVGVVLDDAWEIVQGIRAHRKKERPVTDDAAKPAHRWNPNFLGSIMAVMTVALMVVTVLMIYTLSTVEDYSRCTAQWQQEFGASYKARVEAATPVNDAMDRIVAAIKADDRDAFAKAVNEYSTVRDTQNRERKSNPIPPLPAILCGEPIK